MEIWLVFFLSSLFFGILVALLNGYNPTGRVKKILLSAALPVLGCLWFLNLGMGEYWRVKAGWVTEAYFWTDLGRVAFYCISGILAAEVLVWSVQALILKRHAKKG